jgi:hypothetical protein
MAGMYHHTWLVGQDGVSLIFFFSELRLDLRDYTLSHFTSPLFCEGIFQDRVS